MHYLSSLHLLGLPLIHIAIGPSENDPGNRGFAKGWIAIGDVALGILLAIGGLAAGGVAIGGISLGVLALAGFSLGVWSLGGLALGVYALGGGAVALWAAEGGFALALEFARGGAAIAQHANDPVANAFFDTHFFFRAASFAARYSRWLLALVFIAPILRWMRRGK